MMEKAKGGETLSMGFETTGRGIKSDNRRYCGIPAAWALGFDETGIVEEEEEEEIRGCLLDWVVGPEEGAAEDASARLQL
ncbi:hypothetical protein CK203_067033 [Vitis vinifera]|uniref:Uncharacterized protein n=1 Tax=Vitis vinifera TaxID=29760 RepID=A0A438F4X3_VITVI|nr:hypothetical protein CK203_067033 [Vitis vinifera]